MTLECIAQAIHSCTNCPLNQAPYSPGLPTPGVGSPNAKLMIIGRDPGAEEAEEGIPFIGRAGKVLQTLLVKYNLSLNDVFITNIVKHRPPNNREPTQEEQEACRIWLEKQIAIIQPKAILVLGNTAALSIAAIERLQIPKTKLRGKEFELWSFDNVIKVKCSWHPSYIIRGNWQALDELEEDLKTAIEWRNNDWS